MELRSGRRLRVVSTPGPRRGGRRAGCSDGGRPDLISTLPDDMLLHILVLLRSARDAARTSALSHRWRGLWRHLLELSFREMDLDAVDAALKQVACTALSRLEIDIPKKHRITDPARVSSLIRAAARLAPADLVFSVWADHSDVPIEIPRFHRATSVKLNATNLLLTPPAEGGEFPVLERLFLDRGRYDVNEMIQRCPRLRVLEVRDSSIVGPLDGTIRVHSPTIEELVVDCFGYEGDMNVEFPKAGYLSNVEIVAPALRQLKFETIMDEEFSVVLEAPMLEDLSWSCQCDFMNVGFGEIWYLSNLDLSVEDNVYILKLSVLAMDYRPGDVERDLIQELTPLPTFSVLDLCMETRGHVFGAMVLYLLQTYTHIRRLKVAILNFQDRKPCLPDCSCDAPGDWRTQSIPLLSLEEIEIVGYEGTRHEVDFLKLLFRSATLMKRMIVTVSSKLSPSNRRYMKVLSIFEANSSVECFVHDSSGRC